ncbi:MAG: diaminopimelate dehydrogenase [Clostridia bacterium]
MLGIIGYGALGKAVEQLLQEHNEQAIIYTSQKNISTSFDYFDYDKLGRHNLTYAYMCLSSTILPQKLGEVLRYTSTIDCYDVHGNFKEYFDTADKNAKSNNNIAIVGAGWDCGLFSLARAISSRLGNTHTFWGKGVSLGHSSAVRKIEGVEDCVAYTIPVESEISLAYQGQPSKKPYQKHIRKVIVLPKNNADNAKIARQILGDYNYFADYPCEIIFVNQEEFASVKNDISHKGEVICVGKNYDLTLACRMKSNPYFTACIMRAISFSIDKLTQKGAYTLMDIPFKYFLSERSDIWTLI